MTGGFQTMLASMIASGAIGTALFPGGGTFVGMLFGIAGAGASMALPQPWKDDITYTLGSARQTLILWKLSINGARIGSELNGLKDEARQRRKPFTPEQRVSGLQNHLQRRREIRSDYETILFEKAQLILRYWTSVAEKNPAASRDAIKYLGSLKDAEAKLCLNEEKIYSNPVDSHEEVRELVNEQLAEEGKRMKIVCGFLDSIFAEISAKLPTQFPEKLSTNLSTNSSASLEGDRASLQPLFNYVDVSQKRGFSEDALMEQWKTTAD
jgi:hypothetical protein